MRTVQQWPAIALIIGACYGNAFAQDFLTCDGLWKYTHTDKARGWPVDIELRINGNTGTYLAHLGRHKSKKSPCREKAIPVTVSQCSADQFTFHVNGDSVLKGCPTFKATFIRTGPDTAEGTMRDEKFSVKRVQ